MNITRRRFIEGAGAVAAAWSLRPLLRLSDSDQNQSAPRYNIVCIMTDDQGLRVHAGDAPSEELPHGSWIEFENYICNDAICGPSRASFYRPLHPQSRRYVQFLTKTIQQRDPYPARLAQKRRLHHGHDRQIPVRQLRSSPSRRAGTSSTRVAMPPRFRTRRWTFCKLCRNLFSGRHAGRSPHEGQAAIEIQEPPSGRPLPTRPASMKISTTKPSWVGKTSRKEQDQGLRAEQVRAHRALLGSMIW